MNRAVSATPCRHPGRVENPVIPTDADNAPMATTTRSFRPWRVVIGFAGLVIASLMTACGGGGSGQATAEAPAALAQAGPSKAALATAAPAIPTGWYWNPAESGTGFMVESQGGRAFIGFFMYEEGTGKPIWYAAYGDVVPGDDGKPLFSADLLVYRQGQPANSTTFRAPTSTSVGQVTVRFDGRSARVVFPGGRTMAATRFDIAGTGYDFDNPPPLRAFQPETGWYWNPAEPGRGWAIEVQNDRVFAGMFHYNEDGSPTWNVVEADIATGVAHGAFLRYRGGQALVSAYRGAVSDDIGDFTLSFRTPCAGQAQLRGVPAVRIVRFRVDGSPLPAGAECRAVNAGYVIQPGLTVLPLMLQPGDATYGRIGVAGELYTYAATLRAGVTYTLRLQGAPSAAGTLANPLLELYESLSTRLALTQVGGDSFTFTPSTTGVRYLVARAADGGTGTYLLSLSGSADHLPPLSTMVASAAGSYLGSFNGRSTGTLVVEIDAQGRASGTATTVAGDRPLTGTLGADGSLRLSATGNPALSFSGYVDPGGVLSGTWQDALSSAGLVHARRAPAETNRPPVAAIAATAEAITGVPEPLSGLGSTDADGDTLAYAWQLLTRPQGSQRATLVGTDGPLPVFTADVPGRYRVLLTVDDGRGGTHVSTFDFTVVSAALRPTTLSFVTPATDGTVIDATTELELRVSVQYTGAATIANASVTLSTDQPGVTFPGGATLATTNGIAVFRVRSATAQSLTVSAAVANGLAPASAVRRQIHVRPQPCQQRLLVPAFYHPRDQEAAWELLAANAARPNLDLWVVFNPANGPGQRGDPAYADVLGRIKASGGKVLAYVTAASGPSTLRPTADVMADLRRYGEAGYYPRLALDGVFIDGAGPVAGLDAAANAARLTQLTALREVIRGEFPALRVVADVRAPVPPAWAAVGDVLVTYDGAAAEYYRASSKPATSQPWVYLERNDRFATWIHSAADDFGVSGLPLLLSEATVGARNSGFVFVTDVAGDELAYRRAPSFLERLIDQVAAANTRSGAQACRP